MKSRVGHQNPLIRSPRAHFSLTRWRERWSRWASSRSVPPTPVTGLGTVIRWAGSAAARSPARPTRSGSSWRWESDKARGTWIDPRGADAPLAEWAEEFLRLGRRLSATTLQTYRRDLDKDVLARFGSYRIGRIPPDEIENWLNDEIDAGIAPSSVHRHYRTLRRVLQVAVDKQKLLANPCQRVQPPSGSPRRGPATMFRWRGPELIRQGRVAGVIGRSPSGGPRPRRRDQDRGCRGRCLGCRPPDEDD